MDKEKKTRKQSLDDVLDNDTVSFLIFKMLKVYILTIWDKQISDMILKFEYAIIN